MLLVSLDRQELSNREAVDAEARELVLDAYRSAKISISDPQSKFNAALKRYCKTYPHISWPVARHAVAHIISTDRLYGAPAERATAIPMARRCVWGGEATKIGRGRGPTGTDFGLACGGVGKPPFCGRLVRRG